MCCTNEALAPSGLACTSETGPRDRSSLQRLRAAFDGARRRALPRLRPLGCATSSIHSAPSWTIATLRMVCAGSAGSRSGVARSPVAGSMHMDHQPPEYCTCLPPDTNVADGAPASHRIGLRTSL